MGELKVAKKVGLEGVITRVEDGAIVSWVLNMQKVDLYVTLQ
jgi:hypothetical protein